jgi:hypothetical protein
MNTRDILFKTSRFNLSPEVPMRFHLPIAFSVATFFISPVHVQSQGQTAPKTGKAHATIPSGKEPKPEDPTKAILAAFDKYEVIGMDAAHGSKDVDDLILRLLRDPSFPTKVNDIVVECGNSLYQDVLDRYIAGGDVKVSEVQQIWRNTTQPMCSVSGFYEILFPLVRRINEKLPAGAKRLRVLAGDPPLDWGKVKEQSQVMLDRDANIALVMEKEVLSKHRKALMLFGTFHLFHKNKTAPKGLESAVQRYETDYPGVTMVIGTAMIFDLSTAPPAEGELEERMAPWPVPSLIRKVKGTWLMDINKYFFSDMVDAYLYLGPADLLLSEPRPAEIFLNKEYMAELRRRAEIIGDRFLTYQTEPDQVSDDQFSPFLYGAFHAGHQGPTVIVEPPPKSKPSPD